MKDRPNAIPAELIPLFSAKTAHQSISVAIGMVTRANPEKQRVLLKDSIFQKAVLSALEGLDECRDKHTQQFIDSFAEEIRNDASQVTSG